MPYLKQVAGGVSITPLLELGVGIDHHATSHSRYRKQLNVIAGVTIDQHSILGSTHKLFNLHSTLLWSSSVLTVSMSITLMLSGDSLLACAEEQSNISKPMLMLTSLSRNSRPLPLLAC